MMFFANKRRIRELNSSSNAIDYELKLFKYRTAGVREYWIVDSKAETVFVHNFEKNEMETYKFSDMVPVCIYQGENKSGLKIDFAEILKRI
ncbi:MAG: Uma2 family endonuclease [Lachnospiraceae bacterium]|nr:Uma2 family endonuclease [Lachnospiraceae bacterium]